MDAVFQVTYVILPDATLTGKINLKYVRNFSQLTFFPKGNKGIIVVEILKVRIS